MVEVEAQMVEVEVQTGGSMEVHTAEGSVKCGRACDVRGVEVRVETETLC